MMITYTQEELSSIVHAFAFPGTITDWTPHGNGHINDTFLVRSTENGVLRKSILQRMNRTVFHNPTELMQNIAQVTSFLRKKITAAGGDPFRETLNLIPTTDDAWFFVDERGEFWRAFLFISDASCYDAVTDPKLFYETGNAFGRFQQMLSDIEAGLINCVIVKDLSRLGRNYIEVGRLTEEFFPNHDIRLVAVSDNIDTAEGENELAPIRNLFNEWYARDISKKRRISNKIKGNAGEPMGQPPYGYIKDPNDPKHWIVDDEAAQVVRRVYSMTLEGFGTEQIAAQLEKDDVLTPRAYWLTKGIKRPGKGKQQPPTKWNSSTITKILSLQEYCGDILNFKTYSKSYKNKKRIDNDRENWVVFQDVHEAIIERAVYEQVQQKRGKIRKRRTNNGEHNMFSGLLVCADCGSNLHFHFNQGNPEIKYFNCSNYKGNRGTCTSTHYVRVDFLEEVVLGEIRRLTKFASLYEDEFVKAVIGHSQQAEQTDRKLKEKELRTLLARDEELDGLFERIYEDNVSGKLSDDRFAKMSRRYEDEQKELAEKIKKLRSEIEKQSSRSMTTDMFIGLVRKYTRARKLTPRMLNELVEKIEVFNAEKIDGVWEQRLRIHYNCVGTIEIPTVLPLPIPEVSINTRKGVVVNYAPCELAV